MSLSRRILVFLSLIFLSSTVSATWLHNTQVTQLSSYANSNHHWVWLSNAHPECSHVLHFNSSLPGGKETFSILMAAYMGKKKVDIDAVGCSISEVYVHN